ncbi:class I SAM-dependent methyltransferase [Xenorhabdus bovienii]|uniref:Class I SAM-dependent methyltransferase n=2 Tax=Xenorhabdus bovienii TaxID=40576 RepID=A0AAJ1JAS5_XENBV|nr:class I SAM-dependent methyltransferase [Xenorhabdus bovienii]MDE1480334.1 class I SAM-dependent methyltransferase [Xenorhabdus bovienii]MDE1493128.1 class I SAM-dependent methyltransferase [Xenorhabdus bovienii]MDE9511998.1 class I SAM-dependent methyltransferase [Xenorhabdus bovienii]MDE9523646.1 class I SAM-dependent methyltransferase [Xenorhabdus bovienii]
MSDIIVTQSNKEKMWWEEDAGFFGKLYKEADDSTQTFFEGENNLVQRTNKEVDGVINLCGLKSGQYLIDCPCGYGRHSVALRKKGINVIGIDVNEEHLSIARQHAEVQNSDVIFKKDDMRTFKVERQVDVLINMFYSFGFFSDEENVNAARNFYDALKEGGKFLMHTMITVPAFGDGRIPLEEKRKLQSGRTLVSKRRFNHITKREEGIWSLLNENNEEISLRPYDVRIYTDIEFKELCLEAGFSKVEIYGDWDGSPYNDNSTYLIVVAEK